MKYVTFRLAIALTLLTFPLSMRAEIPGQQFIADFGLTFTIPTGWQPESKVNANSHVIVLKDTAQKKQPMYLHLVQQPKDKVLSLNQIAAGVYAILRKEKGQTSLPNWLRSDIGEWFPFGQYSFYGNTQMEKDAIASTPIQLGGIPGKSFTLRQVLTYHPVTKKYTYAKHAELQIFTVGNAVYIFGHDGMVPEEIDQEWKDLLASISIEQDASSSRAAKTFEENGISFQYPVTWGNRVLAPDWNKKTWNLFIGFGCKECSNSALLSLIKTDIRPEKFEEYVRDNDICLTAQQKQGNFWKVTVHDTQSAALTYYVLTGQNVYKVIASEMRTQKSGVEKFFATLKLPDLIFNERKKPIEFVCSSSKTVKKSTVSARSFKGTLARGSTRALIHTEYGDITIALNANIAPYAVTNFLELAKSGYFDESFFTNSKAGEMVSGGDVLAKNLPKGSSTTIYGTTKFAEKEQCQKLGTLEKTMNDQKNTLVAKWSVLAMSDSSSCEVRSGLRIYMNNAVINQRDVVIMGTVVSGQGALKKLTESKIQPSDSKSFKKFSIELLK